MPEHPCLSPEKLTAVDQLLSCLVSGGGRGCVWELQGGGQACCQLALPMFAVAIAIRLRQRQREVKGSVNVYLRLLNAYVMALCPGYGIGLTASC